MHTFRKMSDLVGHAFQCHSAHCQYPNCRKAKRLFQHGIQCKTLAFGGCVICKKMWHLHILHAQACKESECQVPHCRRQKEHLRTLQQQSDSRQSANVKEMMRQRAAELGETICPIKDDLIMVHSQHACTHCCILMVSGNRWLCNHCKKFQLCDKCYEAEQKREEGERHPINQREKHVLHPVEITDLPADTKEKDEIHNPTAPAFVITCNICHLDIEAGQGWRCEICPDYGLCNTCFRKNGGLDHPHNLTNHPFSADRDAQNEEARQLHVLEFRKKSVLLVGHACQCHSAHCQYPNCRNAKVLLHHGIHCKTLASGGCALCKMMWHLHQLHAQACKESECHVPHCRAQKEQLRRLQQQSDSR